MTFFGILLLVFMYGSLFYYVWPSVRDLFRQNTPPSSKKKPRDGGVEDWNFEDVFIFFEEKKK